MTQHDLEADDKQPAPGAPEGWREALEPFAKFAAWMDTPTLNPASPKDGLYCMGQNTKDDAVLLRLAPGCPPITMGHFRRALAALTSSSAKPGGEDAVTTEWREAARVQSARADALAQSNRRLREGLEKCRPVLESLDEVGEPHRSEEAHMQTQEALPARKPRKLPVVPFHERLAYSVDETAAVIGIAPSTAWEHVRSGALKTTKVGHRTLVRREDLEIFLTPEAALKDNGHG